MHETAILVDAVILKIKGHHLSRIRSNGGTPLFFQFDSLSEQQALSVLNSHDAELIRAYHRTLREVRREMDSIRFQGTGR